MASSVNSLKEPRRSKKTTFCEDFKATLFNTEVETSCALSKNEKQKTITI